MLRSRVRLRRGTGGGGDDPFSLDSDDVRRVDTKYDLSNTARLPRRRRRRSRRSRAATASCPSRTSCSSASSSFDEDVNPDCGDGAGDWRANFGRRRLAHNDMHGAGAAGDCGTGDDAGLSFSWICEELAVLDDGYKQVSGSCATDTEPFPTGAWALKSVEQRLTLLGTWLGTGHYRFTVTAASADARSVDIELAVNEEPSKVLVELARKVNTAEADVLGLVIAA